MTRRQKNQSQLKETALHKVLPKGKGRMTLRNRLWRTLVAFELVSLLLSLRRGWHSVQPRFAIIHPGEPERRLKGNCESQLKSSSAKTLSIRRAERLAKKYWQHLHHPTVRQP